jgi:hypothetical protein
MRSFSYRRLPRKEVGPRAVRGTMRATARPRFVTTKLCPWFSTSSKSARHLALVEGASVHGDGNGRPDRSERVIESSGGMTTKNEREASRDP